METKVDPEVDNMIGKLANMFRSRPADDGKVIRFVVPQAKDRWLTASAKNYTPDRIEQILRGAVSGNLVAQWEMFDLMEGTWPRLSKNLNELKRAVKSLDWNVQPYTRKGEKPTPEAQRRADLLEHALWSMSPDMTDDQNDFEGTLADILDAWGKGISVLEIDWHLADMPDVGSLVSPKATRWIHPKYYGYPNSGTKLMLNTRELANPIQTFDGMVDGFAPFPQNKFILAVAKHKSGHPITSNLLRLLGFWWVASTFTGGWLLNYAQIFGLPIRWATYDQTKPGLLEMVSEMLESMGSAGWAAFPAGTTLELKEASKGGSDSPQAYTLELADRICDILILGQTLTTDVGDSGSRALGDVHQGVRGDVIRAVSDWAAGILNLHFVPAFCRLNFGDERECPWLMPAIKEAKDSKLMAERDKLLLECGVVLPKEWFYNRHDVPMPEDGEDVIEGLSQPAKPEDEGPDPTEAIHAKDATDRLTEAVLEDLTGIEARWLGGVTPFFRELVAKAQDGDVSDEEFVAALERAQKKFPELRSSLDSRALAEALENAMGAAVVNGAVEGSLRRISKRRKEIPA